MFSRIKNVVSKIAPLVFLSAIISGCYGTGTVTVRYFEEHSEETYALSADAFTTESAHVMLHLASDPVCDDTKNNCIRVELDGGNTAVVENVPVGEWFIWTGGFADFKSWTGASCPLQVVADAELSAIVILEPGVGTSICNELGQGVVVDMKDIDGNELPEFDEGRLTLHKSDNAVCDDTLDNCIRVFLEGHVSVAIPDVEEDNWYIWAGGVDGHQAYAGYPCRFDVTADEVIYKEVNLWEGTGTSVCSE
ncbi:hypothetical protein A9Q99_08640 [Gammaproteobacteria bacterium 45_16_T64]|nr:hypothetical protein A9Q99_08640 [Gammaproteobacteria bacterium 45_16_T64]